MSTERESKANLIAIRRVLLAIAAMLSVILIGGTIWLGKAAMSGVFAPVFLTLLLFLLLAEIVRRVEDRINALEERLKKERLEQSGPET